MATVAVVGGARACAAAGTTLSTSSTSFQNASTYIRVWSDITFAPRVPVTRPATIAASGAETWIASAAA
jgi:hypothetical protein